MFPGCKQLAKLTLVAGLILGSVGLPLPRPTTAAAAGPLKKTKRKLDKIRKKSSKVVRKAAKAVAGGAVVAGEVAVVGGLGVLGVAGALYASNEDALPPDGSPSSSGSPSTSHRAPTQMPSRISTTGGNHVVAPQKR
jgi:hypothetical protein